MAVKHPTVQEVEQAFAGAFPAGQAFDQQRWTKLHRAVMNPTWQAAGEGIEVLHAAGARLFRVRWEFGIDKMNTSSEAAMRSSAAALQRRLAALFNGEPVSFATPESRVEEDPLAIVRCCTQGIIG